MKKRVFIFLPDGVGLRNFAFTDFPQLGMERGYEVVYWNNTPFPVETETGYPEIRIENQRIDPLTPVWTNARKRSELNVFDKQFNETVYNTYNFPQSYNGLKNSAKSLLSDFLVATSSSPRGVERIRKQIRARERKSPKYAYCHRQLQEGKPAFVFCTNQRPSQAIAPILAAQDLGIPTGTFIFSWDNLPKATTVIETDYYFVWSDHMKRELLRYCPYVKEEQVFVTGTPQFASHFDKNLIEPKASFFERHGLDLSKQYICFSGDDIVTSPLDQYYLEDMALSVRELNASGRNLGIIYRKCPVDFTDRYQSILETYSDVITSIDPLWRPVGSSWNEIMPSKEDFALQATICEHTEFVANVASSMVFDFVAHHKSCVFFDYEQPQLKKGIRDIGQNYKYIHFRSMPSPDAALWCRNKKDLAQLTADILDGKTTNVPDGLRWFDIVVGPDPVHASERIWNGIDVILRSGT